jgi:hypothetical protein
LLSLVWGCDCVAMVISRKRPDSDYTAKQGGLKS